MKMLKYLFITFLMIAHLPIVKAQDYKRIADSLKNEIKKYQSKSGFKNDTTYVFLANQIAKNSMYAFNFDECKKYCVLALKRAQKVKFIKGEAAALNNMGGQFIYAGKLDSSVYFLKKASVLYTKMRDLNGLSKVYNNLGVIEDRLGHYDKSVEYHQLSLSYKIKNKDSTGIMSSYMNLGVAYDNLSEDARAMEYYLKALKLAEIKKEYVTMGDLYQDILVILKKTKDFDKAYKYAKKAEVQYKKYKLAGHLTNFYSNMATIFMDVKKDTATALRYATKALRIADSLNLPKERSSAYANIATIYQYRKKSDKAMEYLNKGLEDAKKIQHFFNITSIENSIASILILQGKFKQAEILLKDAYKNAIASNAIDRKLSVTKNLFALYDTTGRKTEALYYFKSYIKLRDSLDNTSNYKKIISQEMNYEYARKSIADSLRLKHENDKKLEIQKIQHEAERKTTRIYFLAGGIGLLLVLFIAVFLYRSNKQKEKANRIISQQKKLVEEKNIIIEEKNKDITDSIKYAESIQNALLLPLEVESNFYKENFILFQPRDIVSGDFYWWHIKNDNFYMAVADCTGHGVPGAMMSMLGMGILNDIISGDVELTPADILDQLRKHIIKNLGQKGLLGQSKDGMDISLIKYNKKNSEIQWAGANNPLWILREKSDTIEEIKANKQPVGFHEYMTDFTNHQLKINPGDSVYLFSDGFADQFGANNKKKYKYSRLKEKFISVRNLSMNEQKTALVNEFTNWKGTLEQLDDICIAGIKF